MRKSPTQFWRPPKLPGKKATPAEGPIVKLDRAILEVSPWDTSFPTWHISQEACGQTYSKCWFLNLALNVSLQATYYLLCYAIYYTILYTMGLPCSSVGKESACNTGDPSLIPGLGSSPGGWIGHPLQYSWASFVAQLVKNPLAMQKTWLRSLGEEDSPGERNGYPLQYSGLSNSINRGDWLVTVHGVAKGWTQLKD